MLAIAGLVVECAPMVGTGDRKNIEESVVHHWSASASADMYFASVTLLQLSAFSGRASWRGQQDIAQRRMSKQISMRAKQTDKCHERA